MKLKNIYLSRNQLESDCPAGYTILSFAASQNVEKGKWELLKVMRDDENPNLYFAEFDLPDEPGSRLEFTYELLPGQTPGYLCRLITKRSSRA